tara:strand:- start:434 stop:982 length:549 start_codon:yes stop_codon:yes gene_type:complete
MKFTMFEVPLFHYSIRDWQRKKQPLLDKLPTGEYTDFMSYKRDIEVPPYLDELGACVSEELDDFQQYIRGPIIISNAWCERAQTYDYHQVHQHGATGFSAVLYVDFSAAEHEGTRFYSPFNDPSTGDLMEFQPIVKEGDLVVFPSYLLHEGPLNRSNRERVIVSFNIMGEPESNAFLSGANR